MIRYNPGSLADAYLYGGYFVTAISTRNNWNWAQIMVSPFRGYNVDVH